MSSDYTEGTWTQSLVFPSEQNRPQGWSCEITPYCVFTFSADQKPPNWLWRHMQYLAFGVKWLPPKAANPEVSK